MGINLQTAAGQQWALNNVMNAVATTSKQVRAPECRAREKQSVRVVSVDQLKKSMGCTHEKRSHKIVSSSRLVVPVRADSLSSCEFHEKTGLSA